MKLQYIGTSIYYDVDITAIKDNVVQVTGSNLIMKETGFILVDEYENEYDYSNYTTLYRNIAGGFQYSNDGEIWIEPTKSVTVDAVWQDEGDYLKLRPSSVKISVFDNGQSAGTVTLNEKNNWTKVYENVPESHTYTITCGDVAQYHKEIIDTEVIFTVDKPLEPSVEQQLAELTNVVLELDERVHALEEG